ncbi:MAG: hypothetical protein Fur009_4440 [Candidatus Microgenomates bacterium]
MDKERFYKSGRGHEVLYKILKNTLNYCKSKDKNSGHGGSSESEDQMSVRL